MAYTNDTKPSASSYSNDTKPSASTYSNEIKPTADNTFLLKEDAFFLLLESGYKIVLNYGIDYSYDSKPA